MHIHLPHPRKLLDALALYSTAYPLFAALLAPLAVLLDIPACTETWYTLYGTNEPDPLASKVLSALSLGFSALASALLLVRFSVPERRWRLAMHLSLGCWSIKVGVGITNLIVFGLLARNAPGYAYDEGFWCAVLSLILSVVCLTLLMGHWIISILRPDDAYSAQARRYGRHFIVQNLFFISLIGITSLIMSKLESWTYLQGIFFSVVTFETVGFGDLTPTTTVSRILTFPLALLGIAQLSTLVHLIVRYFSQARKTRTDTSRLIFERQSRAASSTAPDQRTLANELAFLEALHRKRDWKDQMRELGWSVGGFLAFWFVGAGIFSSTEGWDFPLGLYFCYVFFFTIGYGDVRLSTPAGRVGFIVYSLIAVPVMTSFAVQTIASLFRKLSEQRLSRMHTHQHKEKKHDEMEKEKAKQKKEEGEKEHEDEEKATDALVAHAEYVAAHQRRFKERGARDDDALTARALDAAARLERHARRLLIANLPRGSRAQLLLKADWSVQLGEMRAVMRRTAKRHHNKQSKESEEKWRDVEREAEAVFSPLSEQETMEEIARYRESFAGLLAAGSQLRRLKGHERYIFERRLAGDTDTDGSVSSADEDDGQMDEAEAEDEGDREARVEEEVHANGNGDGEARHDVSAKVGGEVEERGDIGGSEDEDADADDEGEQGEFPAITGGVSGTKRG